MQAGDVSLGKIFANDHQNVIPLFQRPYVWDEEANWTPLWEDVKSAAEEVEREQTSGLASNGKTYFLGAIDSQARRQAPRRLSSSNVIDGQQRLTTLQTLLSAARRVAAQMGFHTTVGRFTSLLENRSETIHDAHPEDRYKVWPLPQDNEAFRWTLRPVGENSSPRRHDHKIVRASFWFENQIRLWATEVEDSELRLENLFSTLRDRMQLVHIVLDAGDDPQVIFEALNHRGVPLDAADLVKNLLFQTIDDQGDHLRADEILMKGWLPLDDAPWRDEITTGRLKRSRIDILLSYWLTIRSRREVIVDHLFADFKAWLTSSGATAADVVMDIRRCADTYLQVQSLADSDVLSILLDRMAGTSTTTPWPTLLHLYTDNRIPLAEKHIAVRAIDSFLMRRGMCRMSTGDYNRLFLQVLTAAIESSPDSAGRAIEQVLASQSADSRRWPSDEEFLLALRNEALYTSVYRARLKTFLVGLENHLRTSKTEPSPRLNSLERKLSIEHILPQSWDKYWPLPSDADETRLLRRTSSVHKLGNLTLLTSKLNPSVSNKGWKVKKKEIRQHSLLRLTTGSVLTKPDGADQFDDEAWTEEWDETRIQMRTEVLAMTALEAWGPPPTVSETVALPADERTGSNSSASLGKAPSSDLGETFEESKPRLSEQLEGKNAETDQPNKPTFLTQIVTQADLDSGRIRIPSASKHLFPAGREDIEIVIEDVEVEARWDPRFGPDRERSGVVQIGRNVMAGLVFPGKTLTIEVDHGLVIFASGQ